MQRSQPSCYDSVMVRTLNDQCQLNPGDLIEWVYKSDSQPVDEDAKLWSTTMKRWVPIGVHPMMLISMTDEFYMWLTPKGLFHACVDDTSACPSAVSFLEVVPRVCG